LILVIGSRRFCDSNRSALVYIGILASFLCAIGILFVWNFAAGYYGSKLDEKLELSRQKSSAEELYQTAELIRTEMNALSDEIVFLEDGSSLMPYSYREMNDKLLAAYPDCMALRKDGSILLTMARPEDKQDWMKRLSEGFDLDEIKVFEPSLQDIFVQVAGDGEEEAGK
jgi:hypothetical protein